MNWGDIYDNEVRTTSIWQKIGSAILAVLFFVLLWGIVAVASAYEEHKLCMNGAIEHCIEQDFQ